MKDSVTVKYINYYIVYINMEIENYAYASAIYTLGLFLLMVMAIIIWLRASGLI